MGIEQKWDEKKTKWESNLLLDGESWTPFRLFPHVKAVKISECRGEMSPETCVMSPGDRWRYTEAILPRHRWLGLNNGCREGGVSFTTDVVIPRLEERSNLWMSYTPMEVLTQRPGLRAAKGHVVLAGLGMGWLLQRVAEKKTVKKITLVELSQERLDWILPCLTISKPLEVVHGNAWKIVPKMSADVALIDIFSGYTQNEFSKCPKIGKVWVWGFTSSSRSRSRSRYWFY